MTPMQLLPSSPSDGNDVPAAALEPLARRYAELLSLREQLARQAFEFYGAACDPEASEAEREHAAKRRAHFDARLERVQIDMDKLQVHIKRTGEYLALTG
jgi:hypothetical protein